MRSIGVEIITSPKLYSTAQMQVESLLKLDTRNENSLRPLENLLSRVLRLSSGKNKGLFARLTFDTAEYFFTGRSILNSGP